MRVIIAARLSQESEGQTGIDTQDEDAQEWAENEGHEVIETIADKKSGTVAMWDRPKLRPWVTQVDLMAKYDGIVAAKQDRLSREAWADEVRLRLWAEANGKTLFIVDRNMKWPPASEDDVSRWNDGADQARREWVNTSKRYKRMQRKLRDAGYLTNRPPFGYRVSCAEPCDIDSPRCRTHHKMMVPDLALTDIVREIFERCASNGQPLSVVASWLDSLGIHPKYGAAWSPKTLSRMIRNRAYMGQYQDGEGRTILEVKPIVDAKLWTAANKHLDNTKRGRRGPAAGKPALLTGVIFCARCGAPMYRILPPGRDRGYSYRCAGHLPNRKGCGNLVSLDATDVLATNMLASADAPWTEQKLAPGHNYDAELDGIKLAIRDLAARADELSDAEYDAELKSLRAERDRLKSLDAVPDSVETVETGETVGEHWTRLDRNGRRAMLRAEVKFYADSITVEGVKVPTLRIESRLFTMPLVSE
jgi:DNA invertase Pin-like site-specific DNA recombinase